MCCSLLTHGPDLTNYFILSLYVWKLRSNDDEWTASTCNSTEKFYRHNVEWTSQTKMGKKLHGLTTVNLKSIKTDQAYWTSICDGCGYIFWDASNVLFLLVWFWVHTLMYFFLSDHSFSDFCYSTATGPRTLVGFIAKKWVPFSRYSLQCLIFCTFAEFQCLKFVVMAQDGHKASSNPFLFMLPMSSRVWPLLMAGELMVGIADAPVSYIHTFSKYYCKIYKAYDFHINYFIK